MTDKTRLRLLYDEQMTLRDKIADTDPCSTEYRDMHDEWDMLQYEIDDLEREDREAKYGY